MPPSGPDEEGGQPPPLPGEEPPEPPAVPGEEPPEPLAVPGEEAPEPPAVPGEEPPEPPEEAPGPKDLPTTGEEEVTPPAEESPSPPRPVDVIFVADLDMMNLPFLWQFRREGEEEFRFDNVTFVLNCVDGLIGETDFIALRKKRPRDRTLTRIEEQEAEFRRAWLAEKLGAEREAEAQLAAARARLNRRVEEIENEPGLDERAKEIRIESVRQVEQRRFEAASKAINDEKQDRIDKARGVMNDRIAGIQNKFRFLAIGISPLPAIVAAILIFTLRWRRERIAVPEIRSVKGGA
jgi:ABC-2 type transport system permease protein